MEATTISAETLYESTSSNRNENNISSCGSRLLYSRARCPIIWNLETKQVEVAFHGHKAEVNSQHFVEKPVCETDRLYIISTSEDKTAIIWDYNLADRRVSCLHQFSAPDEHVFLTCQCIRIEQTFFSITTTIDGNIHLWKNDDLLQTLSVKYCCLTSKLYVHRLGPNTNLILLMLSGSDNLVHVFQVEPKQNDHSLIEHLIDLAGYNDWVKCLDVMALPSARQNEFLLASACQDSLVRVWHMRFVRPSEDDCDVRNMRTLMSKNLLSSTNEALKLASTLETVLSGHTGFVHSLCWVKNTQDPTSLELFSCSADKTIILWQSKVAARNEKKDQVEGHARRLDQCPASQGVWIERCRLGETGETNLPFIGACMAYLGDKKLLLAQSLRGAVHSWSLKAATSGDVSQSSAWISDESITGHFDSITDLSWDKSGTYLLSSSLDATCRLHALSKIDNKWHELARPQVHGHGINCIASLNFCKFASGADEKTIRTFEATRFFLKNLKHLLELEQAGGSSDDLDELMGQSLSAHSRLPAHAQLPALGLSNRGASSPYDLGQAGASAAPQSCPTSNKSSSGGGGGGSSIAHNDALPASQDGTWNEISNLVKQLAKIDHLEEPPIEEILLQSTLWWETGKIYGHCNELQALAADSAGNFLASASRANRADLASIIVWETAKYRRVATLEHHSLTITRLRFSPDDKYLLSVSRDRTWSLSERTGQLRNAYKLVCATDKSTAVHERIIWDCSWTHDSRYFVTVSRDRRALLWDVGAALSQARLSQAITVTQQSGAHAQGRAELPACAAAVRHFERSIQAVDALPAPLARHESAPGREYLFAFGFEDGTMQVNSLSTPTGPAGQGHEWHWTCLRSFDNFHQLAIRRLAFRPASQRQRPAGERGHAPPPETSRAFELASGGDDCVLKVTRLLL